MLLNLNCQGLILSDTEIYAKPRSEINCLKTNTIHYGGDEGKNGFYISVHDYDSILRKCKIISNKELGPYHGYMLII